MAAEDFLVDDGCNGKTIEAVGEGFPELDVISAFAFVIEAIYPVDACTLVVAAQQEKIFWVLDFVREEQTDRLQGLLSSVDIVSEEQVVCLGGKSTVLKEPQKVSVLSVNVTTNFQRGFEFQEDRLLQKNLA